METGVQSIERTAPLIKRYMERYMSDYDQSHETRRPMPAQPQSEAPTSDQATTATTTQRALALPPSVLRTADMLAMQRTVGNQATGRLLSRQVVAHQSANVIQRVTGIAEGTLVEGKEDGVTPFKGIVKKEDKGYYTIQIMEYDGEK